MPNGEYKVIMSWLLKLLGALVTAGIVASVSLQWSASQAIERIEAGMIGLRAADIRQERAIERLDNKLDAHERSVNGNSK
jgi:hypothetical protein